MEINSFTNIIVILLFLIVMIVLKLIGVTLNGTIPFIILNVAFVIYMIVRIKSLSKKQTRVIFSVCVFSILEVLMIFSGLIPLDDINPLTIVFIIAVIPSISVLFLINKFIRDIIKFKKQDL